MSLETGARDSVAEHVTANHAVRMNINETVVAINGAIRNGADPANNVHVLQISTKNESLVTAIMDAIVTEGIA